MNQTSPDPMRPRTARAHDAAELVAGCAALLGAEPSELSGAAEVTGVTMDSRAVQPGDLYIALPGAHRHGADFAGAALAAGARAFLTDAAGEPAVRAALQEQAAALEAGSADGFVAVVPEPVRAWVGPLAAAAYGTAERGFPLFAVTGTNGKTTTTYMVNALQQALGRTTGLIGTIEITAGDEAIPSKLTTPESPQVHGIIARMAENGVTGAAMEVSSHAIDYKRVDGLRFDVAGFTNLTQDHLDLHGTMEEYFASKAELFTSARSEKAVILVDDDWGQRMAEHARAHGVRVTTLSAAGREADIRVEDIERSGLGYAFTLATPEEDLRITLPLPGDFNVSNAALAVSLVVASGVPAEQLRGPLADGSALAVTVPGRMQVIATRPAAIVDFAHNPDALARALTSVRGAEESGAKTIIVFGATGDRDATKRETMGRIAAELADVVIVTDDDPHGEDPAQIRAAVLRGAREADQPNTDVLEVHPRADAIREAVRLAGPEDTILVAGRGHETVQEVAGVDLPLDDRVELAHALRTAGYDTLDETPVQNPAQTTPTEGA